MIQVNEWMEEYFIFCVYKKMDTEGTDLEHIQTAYSLIPNHNVQFLNSLPQMQKAIRRYVITNGELFSLMEEDYKYDSEYPEYQEPYDQTKVIEEYEKRKSLIQFYKDMGNDISDAVQLADKHIEMEKNDELFKETLPFTNDDQKAMDAWNKFMKKHYK